ncbi:MAG: nickel pincer cofactor biosynthesis protein LarC [Syntrophales bacterium]|nr:nickel pincer cofactor biosynthesis protein LarC [Syntrophales bacterium]
MKILYYDCFAGISGDMNLGAMIDLGVDRDVLLTELSKLHVGPYEIRICEDKRKGITGTRVEVAVNHASSHHGSHHEARTFRDIVAMIRESDLSDNVKNMSLDIFTRIAEAEGKIHGHPASDVHFHEVGAIDSIVDIVGAAICLEYLKADRIIASPVQVGGGFVKCAHGILPVPAPATVEILRGIPIKSGLIPFETTTPTGAAILAATVQSFTETVNFTPERIGYGIGHRDTEIPNVLRVFLGTMEDKTLPDADAETAEAVMIECNIDDMSPELYDVIMELLFAEGAHDVFFTPIIMKKSRPATKISILCDIDQKKAIEEILWRHSSTFGVRSHRVGKAMLKREIVKVETRYGRVSVKKGYLGGRMIKSKPEYEDCKKLAKRKGLSMKEIYDAFRAAEGSKE